MLNTNSNLIIGMEEAVNAVASMQANLQSNSNSNIIGMIETASVAACAQSNTNEHPMHLLERRIDNIEKDIYELREIIKDLKKDLAPINALTGVL